MTTFKQVWRVGFILVLAGGGSYALAQPKAAPAKAGATETAPKPADACMGDACKHGTDKAGTHEAMGKNAHECPMMHGAPTPTDVSVENTKQGAVIHLAAKNTADVQKIQELAAMIAKHISTGCDMAAEHQGHGDHDKGEHEHHMETHK